MKLKDYTKEELSAMSYDDVAYLILDEAGKKMKITNLFKKVCTAMKLDEKVYEDKIADFFELLSTDKKFIMLDDGSWDLRDKHTQKIKLVNLDEEIATDSSDEDLDDIDLDEDEEEEENIFYENDDDDESENDLKDLVVISEDEEESNS